MNVRRLHIAIWVGLFVTVLNPAFGAHKGSEDDWPSFRGKNARGVAQGYETVTTWNIGTGENILWKTPIPGLAHSSPVIAGDLLFITTAEKEGGDAPLKVGLYGNVTPVDDESVHKFKVYCLNKRTGEIVWERLAVETVPKIKRHPKGSHAAPSPATDGEHVVAFFGSEGLYCYDVQGNLKWSKDFGVLNAGWYVRSGSDWGFASSPVIHDDLVIVQCDVLGDSFVAALDMATGKEVWRTTRTDMPTWSTPTIDVREGRSQVICNGWKHIGGYDLRTGRELWKLVGGGDIPVPTPIVAHDLIYITNAHGRFRPIIAIDVMAEGELKMTDEDEQITWMYANKGNYMQTPLVYGDLIFFCKDEGIVTCYDAKTGEEFFRARLGGGGSGFTASPVAADGKLYYTSEYGEIYVVKADRKFEIVAINDMEIECMATPAISEGVIFWRTRNEIVAVGRK